MAESISKAYLLYVPIEKDYSHTIYFDSPSAQQSYFTGKKKFEATNITYQRKDGVIRFPAQYDKIMEKGCNYVMYQNPAYSNKWFYAFIADMSYENPAMTKISLATDCLQTWMFDITVHPSFVEREHAKTDNVGDNTLDEGLEVGEYVCNSLVRDQNLLECCYIINTTAWTTTVDDDDDKPLAVNMGGIFYAGGAYICNTMGEVVSIIQALSNNSKSDAVVSVYMVPKKIVNNTSGALQFSGQEAPVEWTDTVAKPIDINGYKPKNNKLLCFPYCYILNSNNAGSSNVLRYELFSGGECNFSISGIPVVGGSIKCCPKSYKGVAENEEEGIIAAKFPTLSWSADMFTNWLTQNSLNITMGVVGGAVQVIGGAATMAVSGALGSVVGGSSIIGGVNSIYNTLAQVHQMSFTPNSARGNTNGGDITTANNANTIYFYKMSIRKEYARVIDDFFTMYGYKCNLVKVPEKAHRAAFWYTKTIDAAIDGPIPQVDIQTIKDAYNKGITFWRHTATPKNYNQDNGIV